MVKVNYDTNTGEILGYYPDFVKYKNVPEPYIEIEDDVYNDCLQNQRKIDLTSLMIIEKVVTNDEQLEILRNQKISEFRKKLDDSDYYVLKLADEALTAEEYEPIKIKRASWRAAINAVQVATSIEEINIAMEGSAE